MATLIPHASARALARLGKVIHRYRLDRLLGIGGMAVVYAATHEDGRRAAIKVMLERFHDEPEFLHLFRREASTANQVGHPGAVPVLAHDVDDEGCAFLIMPLLEGETLRARWERAGKRLPVSEVAVMMADVLDVLSSAHAKGIVHRDIKPENLFLTRSGYARVLDFGIARRSDSEGTVSVLGRWIGTPAFMPPEQALGNRIAIGPPSDCWAVGATIFTLLSGEFVHPADNMPAQLAAAATRHARSLGDVIPDLPVPIVQFVDRSLAFDPAHRWLSAREMRDALLVAVHDALGESVRAMAVRLRPELATTAVAANDAGPHLEETLRPDRQLHATRPCAQPTRTLVPGIEAAVGALRRAFHLVPMRTHSLLEKHGFGRFSEDGRFTLDSRSWWPMKEYAELLHEVSATLDSVEMTEICKLIEKYSDRPPTARDIHTAFASLDVAYHLAHRKEGAPMFDSASGQMLEGIGHQRYRGKPGQNLIEMESDDPYPCDVERGIYSGIARRIEPHAIVEHVPGRCRKTGAESCVYQITWW